MKVIKLNEVVHVDSPTREIFLNIDKIITFFKDSGYTRIEIMSNNYNESILVTQTPNELYGIINGDLK